MTGGADRARGGETGGEPPRGPWRVGDRPAGSTGRLRRAVGLPRAARVLSTQTENGRTRSLVLGLRLGAEPGQFAMAWLPGLDEKPFSLAGDDPVVLTVAAVGPFSRAVCALRPGDTLWLRGPLGRGFEPAGTSHLLVGGGYGAAPLHFLAWRLADRGDRVTAVIGARTADDLLLVDALEATGAEVVVTTEDGSRGLTGLVTDAVGPMLAVDPPDTLYACGPHGMLAALEAMAAAAGVTAQLSWEAYMRCGVGLCGSCEHRGLLLCADGPVLRGGERAT